MLLNCCKLHLIEPYYEWRLGFVVFSFARSDCLKMMGIIPGTTEQRTNDMFILAVLACIRVTKMSSWFYRPNLEPVEMHCQMPLRHIATLSNSILQPSCIGA